MRKGFSYFKMVVTLVILAALGLMVAFVCLGWQKSDISGVEGSQEVLSGKQLPEKGDVMSKLRNAINGQYPVVLSEEELNYYIAKHLKLKQGGFMNGFATIKGVFVDLKPDVMEVIILREFAQYKDDGSPNTEYLKPFEQTVSMKLSIVTKDLPDGKTSIQVERPGGMVGNAPVPRSLQHVIKPQFDVLYEHFSKEIDLGYEDNKFVRIKVEDGKITFDPRRKVRVERE